MRYAVVSGMVLCIAQAAAAQSTDGLRRREHPVSIQAAIGRNSSLFGDYYGAQVGPLEALNLAVLGRAEGGMAVRADGWLLRNRSFERPMSGNAMRSHAETTLVVGVGVGGAFRLDLPADLSIEASGSAGVVPYARSVVRDQRDASGQIPAADERTSRTGKGWYLSPGLSIRWKFLVVQQHVIHIMGADAGVRNGENAPLTIGVRW